MTSQEIEARAIEEAAAATQLIASTANEKRLKALGDKWPDAFDLIDDVLNRGINAVKTERDAIKLANPKGV